MYACARQGEKYVCTQANGLVVTGIDEREEKDYIVRAFELAE